MTQITILYTGDIHAQAERFLRTAYVVESQRNELTALGRHVITVDAGDVEDRTLIESELSKGATMFRLLKEAGYTAGAIGNGAAVAYGPQVLAEIAQASHLPLLCANLLTKEGTSLPGTVSTLVIQCGSIQVGLIGLTYEIEGVYDQVFELTMPDLVKITMQHIARLRADGCKLVGVVSHLGYEQDVRLAQSAPGLNFVIGGHSHTALKYPEDVDGVPICHAGDYGRLVGRLDLSVNEQGKVTQWYGTLLPVPEDGPTYPRVARTWRVIQEEAVARLSKIVGYLNEGTDLASDRACGIGQVLADALRVRMASDVAFCITGHLRDRLSEGQITLGDLMRACCSPSNAGVTRLTGEQIVRALEYGADPAVWKQTPRSLRGPQVGILQVSGMTYRLDPAAPAGHRVKDVQVLGKPINRSEQYRVAATDYELMPNHGYIPDIEPAVITFDIPWVMREVLQQHIERFNPLTPGVRPRVIVEPSRPLK